ncbi:unnamed protein product, partial [Closterium sp. Naga37s-1]
FISSLSPFSLFPFSSSPFSLSLVFLTPFPVYLSPTTTIAFPALPHPPSYFPPPSASLSLTLSPCVATVSKLIATAPPPSTEDNALMWMETGGCPPPTPPVGSYTI